MSIVEWPDEISRETCVQCVVCAQKRRITNTTLGLLDTTEAGTVFICAQHLTMSESMRFLRAYIDSGLEGGVTKAAAGTRVNVWRMSSLNDAGL